MAQANDVTKRTVPLGFKILLGGSLAINLAVVGVFAGAAFRKGEDRPQRSGGQINYARPYIQALPREDRRAILEAMRPSKKGEDRATRRALYQEVTDILRVETFDRQAIEAVLLKQTEVTLSGQRAAQVQWLNRIEDMGTKTVANDLDNARVWFNNVGLPCGDLMHKILCYLDPKAYHAMVCSCRENRIVANQV